MYFNRSSTWLAVVALTVFAACSGGAGGSVYTPPGGNPAPGPTPTLAPTTSPTTAPTTAPSIDTVVTSPPLGVSTHLVNAQPGRVNGATNWYTGGVTAWTASAGDTPSGASGTNTMDGVSCTQLGEPSSTTQMHVHAYVGLYVNGTWEAIPSALGMRSPSQPAQANDAVASASCFYNLHTHDYSGLVHIEDSNLAQSLSAGPSYAKLQTFFDIWGEPLKSTQIATFSAPVAIYIGTPTAKSSAGADIVGAYTPFNGDLRTITLHHHVAIWIVAGTPPPAGLPQVEFDVEN